MSRLRDVEPVTNLAWFDSADIRIVTTVEIEAEPNAVFACLADHHRLATWFSSVKSVTNVGPASGVGARRQVRVPPLTVDEVIPRLGRIPPATPSPPQPSTCPVVSQLAEDWQLRETQKGTQVTNVVAADLPRWLRPFKKLVRLGMQRSTSSGPRELKHHIETRESKP